MFTCSISGLSFSDSIFESHFNRSFNISHPIYSLDFKSLVSLSNEIASDPHETSIYMIGLALLNKTRTTFNVPVNPNASNIIINNFQKILTYCIAVNNHPNPDIFPCFIIDHSNSDLQSLDGYLHAIKSVFQDLEESAIVRRKSRQLAEIEAQVDTMIKRSLNFKPKSIAKIIGSWASMAANFPSKPFYRADGSVTSVDQYWKYLIESCFIEDHISLVASDVDLDDLADLIDYCEQYIPHGSTHASILMSKLRKAFKVLEEFRIVPIKNLSKPVMVPDVVDIESILLDTPAKKYEIKTEPKQDKPNRADFKSTVEYLKALTAYSKTVTFKG